MRTTLTLDEDVAALLRRRLRERGLSLKALINELLRAGLREASPSPRKRKPVRTRPADLGPCLIGQLDSVSDALAAAEGEAFR